MTRPTVAAVLARTHPDRTLTTVEPVADGARRRTAIARFESESPLVVRLSTDDAFGAEVALIRAIHDRTPVPVPAPIATGTVNHTAYFVSEYRPGTDLHPTFTRLSPERRRRVATDFGSILGHLHEAFAFDGCGALTSGSDDDPVSHGLDTLRHDCDGWLAEYGLSAVSRLPPAFDPLRESLASRIRAVPDRPPATPRLFPWDLRPGNALVTDAGVVAVVDWERPLAAPPALAVAKVEYLVADWYVDDPAPLRRAIQTGYERVRPYPDIRPFHRLVAVADSAVDARGRVTNPGYPLADRDEAVSFHRDALNRSLDP